MNKSLHPWLVFLFLGASFFYFYPLMIQSSQVQSPKTYPKENYPYEDFFTQQAFPEASPNIENFDLALRQIKQREIYRDAPAGFDAPWTTQGPGNIGARINTIAVHPDNEDIMYAGFSSGGVFKTTDGGQNWTPIFDDQPFSAIGDVVIDPHDSETIYVGTGDHNISGFPFIGDGVYRSRNGGQTWEHLGLRDQRIISKIIIDPNDANTIFAAAMGLPFERNRDRGLYKTTDGGQTWNQVLFISEQTGVIDFLMNPQNPQVLFAAGWDRIRNNKESTVRGDNGNIYRTIDGGQNWEQLTNGLPDSTITRIGLAMSAQNPNVLYAAYVDNKIPDPCFTTGSYNLLGIFKTEDGGTSWNPIPTRPDDNELPCGVLGGFGWYFGKIRVNPLDDNDIFLLGVDLWRTKNGGEKWEPATPFWWEYNVHADKHDLVFTKNNNILLATDGGLYKTDINTEEWSDVENIPATQFYRVAYNPHEPDNYFGGAQDNGTTGGNSEIINEWDRIYGADGFQTLFHPTDPNIFYAETQRGGIAMTLDGGDTWWGATEGIGGESRNWDMPIRMSHHDPEVLYAGTNMVYQSVSDSLPEWVAISPKLAAENDFRDHNMSALSESPIDSDLMYASTSDALVWRGKISTQEWVEISAGLPYRYVSDVIASPEKIATVYVSHSGYKDNDNTPLIHRSDDFGANWETIAGDLPPIAINEMLVLPNQADSILFVATDAGVYATINSGENWSRLGNDMPLVPCYDLVWNEVKNELVVGTFARGIQSYPLDSLGVDNNPPTSVVNTLLEKEKIKLYPNPTVDGAWIEFQNIESDKDIDIVVLDAQGKLIKQEQLGNIQYVKHYVDLQDLPKGAYLIKVKIRHQILAKQLVKL